MLNRLRTPLLALALATSSAAFAFGTGGGTNNVPEPGSIALVTLGLVCAVWAGRSARRRKDKDDR
jgi:hypothetical protein